VWSLIKGPLLLVGGWVVFFLLLQGVVSTAASRSDNTVSLLPDTPGMGLQYATDVVLKQKKFNEVTSHDATGRGRSIGSGHDWKVCEQYETGPNGELVAVRGNIKRNTAINLGAVLLDEQCPRPDQTLVKNPDLAYPIRDYRGYTPAQVIREMRSEASLRFYSTTGDQVTSDYGKWRVCSQQLRPNARFYGQPIAFVVAKYNPDPDQGCPSHDWGGVPTLSGFPALNN
jgi:hypothetical protein